jgi:hypothetical protein
MHETLSPNKQKGKPMKHHQTDTVAALERIEELSGQLDLDKIDEVSRRISANLERIADDAADLNSLAEISGRVAINLEEIAYDETDLRALAELSGRALANLREIAELLDRGDVVAALNR